jgi:ABC-type Na+ efflux pump permease subunit
MAYAVRQQIRKTAFADLRGAFIRLGGQLTAPFLRLDNEIDVFAAQWINMQGPTGILIPNGLHAGLLDDLDRIEAQAVYLRDEAALTTTLSRDLPPKLQTEPAKPPFQFVVHARYNPEQLTVLNIVPGLVCIVLTFSTLIITTLSITRERERGTMENLLAMPVRPIEVMVAKIVPYIAIGYVQVVLIMAISSAVFDLPVRGSLFLLLLALGLFIASNLALGFTFSTIATSQMQAMQMAQFTLLPSILLSGFPFYGMPISMVSSTVLTLLVIPAIYATVKGWQLPGITRIASHICTIFSRRSGLGEPYVGALFVTKPCY